MKERMKEFKFFTIMEYEKEQEYLQMRHGEGWSLIKVTGIGMYHFGRCEPEEVVYQLDYNQEGREHKAEYVQMFADCGWEYITDFVGYSYFRKPVSQMVGDEEIFCDDASRLEMMQRVFRGRMTPVLILLFGCIVPQLFVGAGDGNYVLVVVLLVPLLLWLGIFTNYGVKYAAYKKKTGK